MSLATQQASTQQASIRVEDLSIRISLPGKTERWVHAADTVNLRLEPGRITAVVGESGCGKSVLALALMGLLPAGAITRGSIRFGDVDLLTESTSAMRGVRGTGLGLIPQSAATHLNPVRTIGRTLTETLAYHGRPTGAAVMETMLKKLALPPDTLRRYPHELSGGMAQRVLVAMTLALQPEVVIADEPTSALDSQSAGLVLAALRDHADSGRAVMLITHDLVAARAVADTVAVMYAGRLLETGPADRVLTDPWHGYSRALLAALPENGLNPAPGVPASLVNPDPAVCAWHSRVGLRCAPVVTGDSEHVIACAPVGAPRC